MKRAALIAGVSIAALVSAGPVPAQARSLESWWSSSRSGPYDVAPRRSLRSSDRALDKTEKRDRKSATRVPEKPVAPAGPLHIIVSIDKQRATLFDDGVPVASTAVSTGTASHPTPTGVFTIIQKSKNHISNLYGAAMPYMQRITWSGSALHQGPLPGYPASHGCVRLTTDFAQLLWKTTKLGARVIITREEVAPVAIEHARLFVPKPRIASEPALTSSLVKTADAGGAVPVAIVSAARPAVVETAAKAPVTDGAGRTAEGASAANGAPAVEAEPGEPELLGFKPAEVQSGEATPAETRTAETRTAEADAGEPEQLGFKSPDGLATAVKAAEAKHVESKAVETKPVVGAPAPIIVDERPKTMPATVVQEVARRPISVFVSLKENKLYVRQGWQPLFETPVSFAQPDQPIGTHVYTAMGTKTDGSALRWTVVSIPSSTRRPADSKASEQNRKLRHERAVKAVEHVTPLPSASAALDRIVIPPDVVERISEMMMPGSSLIVSDNKLSDETGQYTDFIVLTR